MMNKEKFVNYAHRGAPKYRPENTMISFELGLSMGSNGIETDVQKTADGVLVLFHDDEISRTSNGVGKISDYTFEELMKLDVGGWFDEKFQGTRIPTFLQFCQKFSALDLTFAIELKAADCEKQTLEMLEKFNMTKKSIITSFKYDFLKNTRALDENIRIGYLVDKITEENLAKLKEIGGIEICPKAENTSKEDISLAKAQGFDTRLWGVFNEDIMNNALTLDISGMTCNFPDKLTKALSLM